MRLLAVIVVLAVSATGLLHSSHRLAAHHFARKAEAREALITGGQAHYFSNPLHEEFSALYDSWQALASFDASLPEVKHRLGRAELLLSLLEPEYDKKIEHFCSALQSFRQASQRSPHNPRYHIAWADIMTQVPDPRLCSANSGFSLSPAARLEAARNLAPYSVTDLYLAAVVYVSLGQKLQALDLLRLVQEINPVFSTEQREYTYRLVTSEEHLRRAMPQRYPEVLSWIWHFSRLREHDYIAWRPAFASALHGAVSELKERGRQGKIPPEFFSAALKSINSVPLAAASPVLRRELDEVLANVYEAEDNAWWASVLRERLALARLPVLKAVIVDDKLPRHTMLFGWVGDDEPSTAALDFFGRSAGLYVPQGGRLRLLILQAGSATARLAKNDLEVLWSSDNLEYHPLPAKNLEISKVDGYETVVLRLPESGLRYLKIRYLGGSRNPRFINSLSSLVQAYGELPAGIYR